MLVIARKKKKTVTLYHYLRMAPSGKDCDTYTWACNSCGFLWKEKGHNCGYLMNNQAFHHGFDKNKTWWKMEEPGGLRRRYRSKHKMYRYLTLTTTATREGCQSSSLLSYSRVSIKTSLKEELWWQRWQLWNGPVS